MKDLIVIVEDDFAVGRTLVALLKRQGHASLLFSSAEAALARLRTLDARLLLTDVRLGGRDGLWLLDQVTRELPGLPVVVMTAHGTIPIAVEAMRKGARDFLTKPFRDDELRASVERALANSAPEERGADLESGLVGDSEPMAKVRALITRVAKTQASVLLLGESGTGKEVAARAIHRESTRASAPFIAVHCAAIPESLIESELFGHEKGAFSGAVTRKPGRFELAHLGTLLLDEVGELPLSMQVKLLRFLQEQRFERIGGTESVQVDVRVIAATHRDLRAMVAAGTFREDLYYRLHVLPIELPPLRERPGDIELLTREFLARFKQEHARPNLRLLPDAQSLVVQQPFPGNVRELANLIERLVVLSERDDVTAADLVALLGNGQAVTSGALADAAANLVQSRHDAERLAIANALRRTNNNRSLAARMLGVSRRTLYNRLAALGLQGDAEPAS
jgi:DNA-binding NtrC family response regulator